MKLVQFLLPFGRSRLVRSRNLPSIVIRASGCAAVGLFCLLSAFRAWSAECVPPPAGLVSWWPGEGNANDAADGNSGGLLNGATFAPGRVGQAFSFDGTNSYARISDNPNLHFTNALTIEAWIYPISLGAYHNIVSKWGVHYPLQTSYTTVVGPDGRISLGVCASGDQSATPVVNTVSTNSVLPNQWTHFAATYDGSALRMYLNGVCEDQVAYNQGIFPGTEALAIGAAGAYAGGQVLSPFSGLIDEPAVYNRALSGAEIQAIYNAGSAGKCLPAASGDYSPGFTWQRSSDWRVQPASYAGTTNGNPVPDSMGNPVWSYEWVQGGGALGTANPWYIQPSRRLVWDMNWYATGASGWARADDVGNGVAQDYTPLVMQTAMTQSLSPTPPITSPDQSPLVRWMNPADEPLQLSISGIFSVGWEGLTGGYPVNVDLVVAQESAAGAFHILFTNTVSKPHSDATAEVLDVPVNTSALVNPGDNLLITLRANGTNIGNWITLADPLTIVVEARVPPVITSQPLSQTANAGDNATFSVAVAGTGAQFQWRFNSTNLVGQTNGTLTLNSIRTNQAGIYDVRVSRGTASVLSDPAELTVPLPGQPGSKKWQFTCGGCVASPPALAKDGTIYVAACGALIALTPAGSQEWWLPLPGLVWGSPSVAEDGTIYVMASYTNLLYAVNPNGTVRWQSSVPGVSIYSPSLAEDGAIVVPGGPVLGTNVVVAFNTDGTIRWQFDPGGSPMGAALGWDGTIYIGDQFNNVFHAVKPDGVLRWSISPFPVMWGMAIIGSDGTIYVGTRDDQSLIALDPQGNFKWRYPVSNFVGACPSLAADGTIYCLSQDGHLYALNPNGGGKWVYDLGAVSYSSPAVSKHGTIYTSANDKKVVAINPDGTKQWEFATGSADTHPYEGRRARPTIAPDGTIYFAVNQPGIGGVIFAIQGDSGPAESPWPMAFQNAQHTSRVPFALTNQPENQIVLGGSNVVFSVGAASTQPCVFQWRHNGNNMLSQTNAALFLPNVASDAEGVYACLVSNRSGAFVSYNASLTVLFPPVITQQPTNLFVLAGSGAIFSVAATGTQPLSYQWALNGTLLPGDTSTMLSLSNVSGLNAGFYTMIVSNLTGSVTSTPALLDVRYSLAYGNGGLLPSSNYTFIGSVGLQLWSVFPNANIFYTLDSSEPSFESSYYAGPFNLSRSATLRVIAYSADFLQAAEAPPIYITVIPTYGLNLISPGGGTVTASPPASPYVSNTVVTLTPQPSNGWTFLEWRGDASGTSPTVDLTMNRARTVQAIFGTTLGTTVAGNGAVNVYPALPLHPYGTVARLTAIPQAGSYFAVWGNSASGNTNPLYFTVTSAAPIVSSLFSTLGAPQRALTVIPDGFGSVTITPQANVYTTGASATLNAMPDPGQQFLAWSGDATGSQNPLAVTMNTSKTITATFTRKPSLTVAPPLDGLFEDCFRLTLKGEIGQAYRIYATTNLVSWASLTILTNAYGTVQLTDPIATNTPYGFYRAVSAP